MISWSSYWNIQPSWARWNYKNNKVSRLARPDKCTSQANHTSHASLQGTHTACCCKQNLWWRYLRLFWCITTNSQSQSTLGKTICSLIGFCVHFDVRFVSFQYLGSHWGFPHLDTMVNCSYLKAYILPLTSFSRRKVMAIYWFCWRS